MTTNPAAADWIETHLGAAAREPRPGQLVLLGPPVPASQPVPEQLALPLEEGLW